MAHVCEEPGSGSSSSFIAHDVGSGVGETEGLTVVGKADGVAVTAFVGLEVVGNVDGFVVGPAEGRPVVGLCEGEVVGGRVGEGLHMPHVVRQYLVK